MVDFLRMDWLELLAVQGILTSLLQHHSSNASILWRSACFTVQLPHPYMTTGKTTALTRRTYVSQVMSLFFNMLSRLVITFLSRSKVKVKSLRCVWLFATPWSVAYQASPSMGFSRQEYWGGLPFPSPGDLSNPGIEPWSPTLEADALTSEPPGKLHLLISWLQSPSAMILEPQNIKSATVSTVSPSICHEVGPEAIIFVFCWVLSQLFHSPLSLSSRGFLVPLHFLP